MLNRIKARHDAMVALSFMLADRCLFKTKGDMNEWYKHINTLRG